MTAILFGCSSIGKHFKNTFVNNYDGAGYFNKLIQYRNNNLTYIDSLNLNEGFDAIVVLHVKIADYSEQNFFSDEIKSFPEIHFALTNEFINSDKELKEEIYWRGDLARYYKDYVYGNWIEESNEKSFDSYSVFEVKSKMNIIIIDNLYLRFYGDKWIKIPIDKKFKIERNKIDYLGTLSIDMYKTDEYSGKVIHQVYTPYMTGTKEGYVYNVNRRIEFNTVDFKEDLKWIELNYPILFENYKNCIVYFEWN